METTGLGHRRILKDDEVIRRAVDFISESAQRSSSSTVAVGSHTAVRASGTT
jgi:hypothetical protein